MASQMFSALVNSEDSSNSICFLLQHDAYHSALRILGFIGRMLTNLTRMLDDSLTEAPSGLQKNPHVKSRWEASMPDEAFGQEQKLSRTESFLQKMSNRPCSSASPPNFEFTIAVNDLELGLFLSRSWI